MQNSNESRDRKRRLKRSAGLYTLLLYGVGVMLLVLVAFALLQPTVSARLFAFQRKKLLDQFMQQMLSARSIDPQRFWEFRQRFSPGHFSVNPAFVETQETFHLTAAASPSAALLFYQSPFLTSTDGVLHTEALADFWQQHMENGTVLFADAGTLVIEPSPGTVHFVFVKPIAAMMAANGFFDYTRDERALLTDYLWFNETTLTLP